MRNLHLTPTMRVMLGVFFLTAGTGSSFAQTTSEIINPDWTNGAHWTGTAPGYDMNQSATLAHNSTITQAIKVGDGEVLIIEEGVTLSTSHDITIEGTGKIIVRGTIVGTGSSKTFKITGSGSLIVEGTGLVDWKGSGHWDSNSETATVTIDGKLKIGGNFINKAKITGSGSIEVSGNMNNQNGGELFGCSSSGDTCCNGTSPCSMSGTLPVTLLYFEVSQENDNVVLNWATVMEENFRHFVIQRSADGLSYDELGEVGGKGFNIYDITSKYSFTDEAPLLGYNYYRIKAVDLDDTFEYFGVTVIRLSIPKKVAVYPNPSEGNAISFRTNFSPSETDRIVLLDQVGIEVFNAYATGMENTLSFENILPAGVYTLRYLSKHFEATARVVVKN